MAPIGFCCGRPPPEADRLPPRVPNEIAENIQRNTQLTLKEVQGLYERFRKYAPNGRLMFSRFCDTLGVLGMLGDTMIAERMFQAFDQDKDRELSFTEFGTALGIMMRGTDDQKLDLSFRILNPTYTGTGECLDDYRYISGNPSVSSEEVGRPTSRPSVNFPPCSGDITEGTAEFGNSSRGGWRAAATEEHVGCDSQLAAPEVREASDDSRGRMTCTVPLSSGFSLRVPGDLRWFERQKSVIYADSLGLDEFVDLVRCLQASRRALLGGEGIVAPDEEIATVFLPLASEMPDGSRRMLLKDFKGAVQKSPRFLCLLGVASSHMHSHSFLPAELAVSVKPDRKASLVSSTCTGASLSVLGASPNAAEIRASVRAELLRRVRHAEARVELQQRQQQQQHRQQLQQLAESLKAVEKDVEALKKALAAEDKPITALSTRVRTRWLRQNVSSPAQRYPELESAMMSSNSGGLGSSSILEIPYRRDLSQENASSNTTDEASGDTSPTGRALGNFSSNKLAYSVINASRTSTATAPAAAATAAAAAAVVALQQAEQQLNRILEESSAAASGSVHIADQLLLGMGSTSSLDASQSEPARASALYRELTSRSRRSVVFCKRVTGLTDRRVSEGDEESVADAPLTALAEVPRQQRVSFSVNEHIQKLQEPLTVQDAVCGSQEYPRLESEGTKSSGILPLKETNISVSSNVLTSGVEVVQRTNAGFARRMYMNRAKVYQSRTPQRRHASDDPIHGEAETAPECSKVSGKETKGLVVHFGHESWNMVINIMVGIRLAGGRALSEPHRAVEPYDFVMKEKFSVLPKTGMVDKRQASLCAVRFIDYAPMVFRRIRAIFGIDSHLYIRSVGPEQLLGNLILGNLSSLSELVSEGKSGSLFYYTTDGRFMIKTISKDTAFFMRSILFDYYKHVSTSTNTLLTRFCGLHAIRLKDKSGQILGRKEPRRRKTYFMVMENFFHTPVEIHRRYDLKGSTKGRSLPPELLRDSTVARKDNDMTRDSELIEIGEERKRLFIDQITADAAFLRDHGIMDYSLLLGISYASMSQDSIIWQNGVFQASDEIRVSHSLIPSSAASVYGADNDFEQPFWSRDLGGMQSSDHTKLYYVGIIDILTHWNAKKKLEHVARVLQTGSPSGASCVNPTLYSQRFIEFISRHTI